MNHQQNFNLYSFQENLGFSECSDIALGNFKIPFESWLKLFAA